MKFLRENTFLGGHLFLQRPEPCVQLVPIASPEESERADNTVPRSCMNSLKRRSLTKSRAKLAEFFGLMIRQALLEFEAMSVRVAVVPVTSFFTP